jgi:hypothetical protein
MVAYLLLFAAVLSRLIPHAGWMNFTAVGAALLYFGARRPAREMFVPVAALLGTDLYLTLFSYHYAFHWQDYIPTWTWYAAAIVLGRILLSSRTSLPRFLAAVVLGPTSFFVLSNFAVWYASGMYAKSFAGLTTCYVAALPFYRNDLVSTTVVAGLAFGIPVLVHRLRVQETAAPAGVAH